MILRRLARAAVASLCAVGIVIGAVGCGNESLGAPDEAALTLGEQSRTNAELDRLATFFGSVPDADGNVSVPSVDSDEFWDLRRQAAEALRDELVFAELARRCGPPCAVTKAEIDGQVELIIAQEFQGARQQYEQTLEERGITEGDLRGLLRSGLQEQKLSARVGRGESISEEQARAYYTANVKEKYTTEATSQLSHILVPTRAEALSLRPNLTAANFAEQARANSTDADAGESGGVLGSVDSAGLIPEIAAAAATLKPGVISQPVQTQFGWHLLLVERIPASVKTFEDVRDAIIAERTQARRDAKVERWRTTTVARLADRVEYANSRLAPQSDDSTTSTETGATDTTGP